MKNNQSKNGTVLLMALLVMAGIMTISLATGTLISSEIQQSSQLDKATLAYYAAESAVERAMYQVRKAGTEMEVLHGITALLPNNAYYEIIALEAEPALYTNLNQDETLELDLFQVGSMNPLTEVIKSLRFDWPGNENSWLEVRWLPWTTGGVINPNPSENWNWRGIKISLYDSPYTMNLYDSGDYLYKVRVTARSDDIENLTLTAYNIINPSVQNCQGFPGPNSSCSVDIPQRIKIKGIGEYPYNNDKSSKQAILVTLKATEQLSGLYDYVIFTEEEIVK